MTVISSFYAQDNPVNKIFYVELIGPGVAMSINYDARFISNSRFGLGYRIGIGYGIEKYENKLGDIIENRLMGLLDDEFISYIVTMELYPFIAALSPIEDITSGKATSFISFPIGLNYIFGKQEKSSSFELGAGVTLLSRKAPVYNYQYNKPGNIMGFMTFMYRLTPVNGGFSFRVGITPIIGTSGDFYPTGAMSFGYAF